MAAAAGVLTSTLPAQRRKNRKEEGCDGRDARTQAIHIVEDAERGGDARNPKHGEKSVR